MTKIVINVCHGGYSLSDEAQALLGTKNRLAFEDDRANPQLIRLDNQPTFGLFWLDRKSATEAALARGIYVAEDGSCYTTPEDLPNV